VATYAQLNQEAAWRNEFMPEPMRWFCRELARALGVPQANVGAKGDNASGHMRGGHRSQRWILTSRHCTNRTYTVSPGLPANLLDALGAIDITPKNREQMLLISQRIDAASRAGRIEEVVAWYGNTNNDTRVDGWDNVRNAVASSDASHLWHLHLTFDRHVVGSRPMFERLLAILLGRTTTQSQEEDMPKLARWDGNPAVFVCYSDGTARWVRTPNELNALQELWGGAVTSIGDAAAIGFVRGTVPDDWPKGDLMPNHQPRD
jgi:hypothetical protein